MDKIVDTLKNQYSLTIKPDISALDFLHILYSYMDYINNQEITKKIIFNMKESYLAESIKLTRDSFEYSSINEIYTSEIKEDMNERYPVVEYNNFELACKQFALVKHLKSEDEIYKEKIIYTEKTELGESTITGSGAGLLNMTNFVYKKYFPILHNYILEQLEWVKQHNGVFSKYFDYSEKDGILYFQNKEIPMNIKKVPTNAHYLLAYLFKNNPFEKHYCDQLDDDKVLFENKKHWKSYLIFLKNLYHFVINIKTTQCPFLKKKRTK